MDFTKEFRLLSLCSGYGGIELGLRRIIPTLRTVAYVEIEAFAVANLAAKMEKGLLDAAPVWTDIKTFNGQCFRGKVDIITAGYPCQPFSVAGKRKGTDDPRHLWPHIERIIEAIRPVWFFGENVSGHLALGFPEVYRSLRNMGYAVEAGLFTAAECGAPHRRERLFILAYNKYSESRTGIIQKTQAEIRRDRFAVGDTNMADSNITGCKEQCRAESIQEKHLSPQCSRWPAQPGQPQYEWEEPRVVGYALQGNNRARKLGQSRQSIDKRPKCNSKKAQSSVGRTAYGTSCRVDRLRLLGNGVVPQQAERAFKFLYEKLNK